MTGRQIRKISGISGNSTSIENVRTGAYSIEVINVETGRSVFEKFIIR